MKRAESFELASAPTINSPEAQLLLLCARMTLSAAQRDALIAVCRANVDWNRVESLALRHGLNPLLHRHLGNLPAGIIPTVVQAGLWACHEQRARRNDRMARELVEIVEMLAREGLRVVPYKGPTLAVTAYGDLALREFGDLDLLVRPSDAIRICPLLQARGYEAEYALSPDLEKALVRSTRHYELPLRDHARNLLVELHWRADPEVEAMPIEDPRWWNGLGQVRLGEGDVPGLRTDDLMLALCLHGTKHRWASLGWLVDVAELARRNPDFDWEALVARAVRLQCRRRVTVGLVLATDLLQAPIPARVLAARTDSVARRCAAGIQATLFDDGYQAPSPARIVAGDAMLQDSVIARTRLLRRTLFTPGLGDWQRWPSIPPAFSFLYWLLRPIRLAEKYLLRRTPPAATPRTPRPRPHSTG